MAALGASLSLLFSELVDGPKGACCMLNGAIGSIAHLAYHLGAIRQIDRGTRGPSAEQAG